MTPRIKIIQGQRPSNAFPIVIQVNGEKDIYFQSLSSTKSLIIHDALLNGLPPFIDRHYFGRNHRRYAKIVAVFKPKNHNQIK